MIIALDARPLVTRQIGGAEQRAGISSRRGFTIHQRTSFNSFTQGPMIPSFSMTRCCRTFPQISSRSKYRRISFLRVITPEHGY